MKQLTLLLLTLPFLVAAQTKKPAPKKPTTVTTLDVDRLYKKYKEWETVTIHTANGDIKANVKCMLNDNSKPYAVILYGYCETSMRVQDLANRLGNEKTKSGYSDGGTGSVFFDTESIVVNLYQKKSQYAKYGVTPNWMRKTIGEDGKTVEKKPYLCDFFYFEVGDITRRSTGKQESFSF